MQHKYLNVIFTLIHEKENAHTILIKLLTNYIENAEKTAAQQSLFYHPRQYKLLAEKMLKALTNKAVDVEEAVKNAMLEVVAYHNKTPLECNDDIINILSDYFSIYPNFIFCVTNFLDAFYKKPDALVTRFNIKRNIWMKQYPHSLEPFLNRIYCVALAVREDVCASLTFLTECIQQQKRATIIRDILKHINDANHFVRSRACENLGLLCDFIPATLIDEVVKAVLARICDENHRVIIDASIAMGRLAKIIPKELLSNTYFTLFDNLLNSQLLEKQSASAESLALITYRLSEANVEQFISRLNYLFYSETDEVRQYVCEAIGTIGKNIPLEWRHEVLDGLLCMLNDHNPLVRMYACDSLGKLKTIIPEIKREEVMLALYEHLLDFHITDAFASTLIALKEFTLRAQFDKHVQEIFAGINDPNSDFKNELLRILSLLTPCLSSTHLEDLTREFIKPFHGQNLQRKIDGCFGLKKIGVFIPAPYISELIDLLATAFTQIDLLKKHVCTVFASMATIIPDEQIPFITRLLLRHITHPDSRVRGCICEALEPLSQRIPSRMHKKVMLNLTQRLTDIDKVTQENSYNSLLALHKHLTFDLRTILLGQLSKMNNIFAQKLFVYFNHRRTISIDLQHKENLCFYRTSVRDVATIIRNHL